MRAPTPLPRVPAPSRAHFDEAYFAPGVPVVFTDMAARWPAIERWSDAYLCERFGDSQIPVMQLDRGEMRHDEHGIIYEPQTYATFLESRESPEGPMAYLSIRPQTWCPWVFEDIIEPPYMQGATWWDARLWSGVPGIASPLHREISHNLHTQVSGRKRFILWHPSQTKKLYPHGLFTTTPNYAHVDPNNYDIGRYPRFRDAVGFSCVLEPGETIFVPRAWWHHVTVVDSGLSFNHWWTQGLSGAIPKAAAIYKWIRRIPP